MHFIAPATSSGRRSRPGQVVKQYCFRGNAADTGISIHLGIDVSYEVSL